MKHTPIMATLALGFALTGCGSDSDSTPSTPEVPEVTPPAVEKPDYVFGGPLEKEQKLNTTIQFAIVKGFSPLPGGPVDGGGGHSPAKPGAAKSEVAKSAPSGYVPEGVLHSGLEDTAAQMGMKVDYLLPPTVINMAGVNIETIRPDLFPEGRGSVLDLLLWASEKYDLDVEIEKDEALNTYFVTSINGITGLPEKVDQDNLGGTEGQGWKYLVGTAVLPDLSNGFEATEFKYKEEEMYFRIDHFALKNENSIVLMPAQPGEMEIRKQKYRKEMERLAANDGKVIIPEIVIDFKPAKYSETGVLLEPLKRAVFKDVEVTAHNMRPDLYQPGVLTELDAWLSLAEQREDLDIEFSYWPRLSSKSNIQGYVATAISFNGRDDLGNVINERYTNNGECGFVHHTGEWENYADSGRQHMLYEFVMCGSRTDMGGEGFRAACMGKVPGIKGWRPRHFGAGEQYENLNPKGRGYLKFGAPFGGNDPHLTGDAMIIYGPEYINYIGAAFGSRNSDQGTFSGCDVDSPQIDFNQIKDISKARAPLTESHFGWKVPNCATCHDSSNSHVAKDMGPWECAECHGNNGAPNRHAEVRTCGLCHATSLEGHGDVFSNKYDYFSEQTNFKEPESCLTCHVDKAIDTQ